MSASLISERTVNKFHKYLPVASEDLEWGLEVLDAGCQECEPGGGGAILVFASYLKHIQAWPLDSIKYNSKQISSDNFDQGAPTPQTKIEVL